MAVPLVFIAEESYSLGLAATLRSVVKHTQPCPTIYVAPVLWVPCPTAPHKPAVGAATTAGSPKDAAWLKLALPQLLPTSLGKVLYLDSDMIALASLQPLLQIDLQGHVLAAVRDVGEPCGHDVLRAAAGWPDGGSYFNSGLLLVDLPKLAAAEHGVQSVMTQHGPALRFRDQDLLNLVCAAHGGWLELPAAWNAQGLGSYATFRTKAERHRPALFTPEQLRRLEREALIVHFTGPPLVTPSRFLNPYVPYSSKPWAYLCNHPHRDTFFALLDETPWRGWRPSQGQLAVACAQEAGQLAAKVAAEHADFDCAAFFEAAASALAQQAAQCSEQ